MLCILLGSGCATPELWGEKWTNEPAPKSRLAIRRLESRSDFLVQFDELHGGTGEVERRAYLLKKNEKRIQEQRKPRYLKDATFPTGEDFFVFDNSGQTEATQAPQTTNNYARLHFSRREFDLVVQGTGGGTHPLPYYRSHEHMVKRIALTPLAALADATGITFLAGAVAGAVGGVGYALYHSSGWEYPNPNY
jgi:hypothetical protein